MDVTITNSKPLKNYFAWGIVILPIIGSLPPEKYDTAVTIIAIVALAILVAFDRKELEASGYTPPQLAWGIVFAPVYLWKRSNVTHSKKIHFFAWFVAVIISVVLVTYDDDNSIAETACPVVSQIIKENVGRDAAQCVKVSLGEKVTDKFYKATAMLDNGNDIDITIELQANDMVYVRVPSEYLH